MASGDGSFEPSHKVPLGVIVFGEDQDSRVIPLGVLLS